MGWLPGRASFAFDLHSRILLSFSRTELTLLSSTAVHVSGAGRANQGSKAGRHGRRDEVHSRGASPSQTLGLSRPPSDLGQRLAFTLEQIAILSLSKRFLSAPLLQRAISLIHSGQILFTSPSSPSRALLPDTYPSSSVKGRGGRLVWRYDARREGGWLGLERLRIPKWREVIEIIKCVPSCISLLDRQTTNVGSTVSFALIIGTFVLCACSAESENRTLTAKLNPFVRHRRPPEPRDRPHVLVRGDLYPRRLWVCAR